MIDMINLTPLFEAVIAIAIALVARYAIPWIKEKLTAEQLTKARAVVEIAVYAAEKAFGAGNGKEKLEYAQSVLAAHGVKLDTIKLHAMIDAAIKKMEQSELYILEAAEAMTEEA